MFNSWNASVSHFNPRPPLSPPPGSVIVTDNFYRETNSNASSHGLRVASTVVAAGFPGAVVANQKQDLKHPGSLMIQSALGSASFDKNTTMSLLSTLVDLDVSTTLDSYSAELYEGLQMGEFNSVRNFSSGISKSTVVEGIFSGALAQYESDDPQLKARGQTTLDNFARAYDLSFDALTSGDRQTRVREKARLFTGLAQTVSETIDHSPNIAWSRQRFRGMVRAYESRNNSVVLAAGNHGRMRELAGEFGITLPQDVDISLLAVNEVTVVGAAGDSGIADYSSRYSQVDIYADGDSVDPLSGESSSGTSYAAPRVAAVMASLHALYPQATSEEVEEMMRTELTRQVGIEDGIVSVLNGPQRAPALDILVG